MLAGSQITFASSLRGPEKTFHQNPIISNEGANHVLQVPFLFSLNQISLTRVYNRPRKTSLCCSLIFFTSVSFSRNFLLTFCHGQYFEKYFLLVVRIFKIPDFLLHLSQLCPSSLITLIKSPLEQPPLYVSPQY